MHTNKTKTIICVCACFKYIWQWISSLWPLKSSLLNKKINISNLSTFLENDEFFVIFKQNISSYPAVWKWDEEGENWISLYIFHEIHWICKSIHSGMRILASYPGWNKKLFRLFLQFFTCETENHWLKVFFFHTKSLEGRLRERKK